mmetsp:Transcript_59859/g.142963  ORF Transcript_59859/g.142963 Transcript_59859/m.142963 type:complete len:237 (+) Transcript_59859:279-989(+)
MWSQVRREALLCHSLAGPVHCLRSECTTLRIHMPIDRDRRANLVVIGGPSSGADIPNCVSKVWLSPLLDEVVVVFLDLILRLQALIVDDATHLSTDDGRRVLRAIKGLPQTVVDPELPVEWPRRGEDPVELVSVADLGVLAVLEIVRLQEVIVVPEVAEETRLRTLWHEGMAIPFRHTMTVVEMLSDRDVVLALAVVLSAQVPMEVYLNEVPDGIATQRLEPRPHVTHKPRAHFSR